MNYFHVIGPPIDVHSTSLDDKLNKPVVLVDHLPQEFRENSVNKLYLGKMFTNLVQMTRKNT